MDLENIETIKVSWVLKNGTAIGFLFNRDITL
jgi:hypothetical protein